MEIEKAIKIMEQHKQTCSANQEDKNIDFMIRKGFLSALDRYAFIEHEKEQCKAYDTAIQALEKQKNNGWIPVSERLPDNQQRVLVSCDKCPIVVGWLMWGEWYTDYGKGYGIINVIAWQPLPEPYEELI